MVGVIPFLGFWFARKNPAESSQSGIQIKKYIPLFVIGYVTMGVARTAGDYLFGLENQTWINVWTFVKTSATYVITVAIACVGLNTDLRKLSTLGIKPFICGFTAALSVGLMSWFLVSRFGKYLTF